jgi:hypothetical protein
VTICVAVKVAEGLVLAADSAVVLEGVIQTPQGPVQTIIQNYEYANKVTHRAAGVAREHGAVGVQAAGRDPVRVA